MLTVTAARPDDVLQKLIWKKDVSMTRRTSCLQRNIMVQRLGEKNACVTEYWLSSPGL